MRLFTKIAVTLAATILAGTTASALAVAFVFIPQYFEMDRAAALTNAGRVYEFLQAELDTAATYAGDWGHWDETFAFARKFDKDFVARNLKQEDLETIRVDEFVIAGFDRRIKFELRADRAKDAPAVPFANVKSVPEASWRAFSGKLTRESWAGYAATPAGPAIVSTAVITDSNGQGPSPGMLIFVRLVDEAFLTTVRQKTKLDFTLTPAAAGALPKGNTALIGSKGDIPVVLAYGADKIDAVVALKDVSGAASFIVRVTTPMRFTQVAGTTFWLILAILCAIGGVAVLVLAAFMRRVVTRPIEQLIEHARMIAATGNLDKTMGLSRRDEIGVLAGAFDRMIGDLREARLKLQEQSFVSGMANVAAEMLHNIRNSLSPVSTAIWKGRESLKEVKTDRLAQAGAALAAGEGDPERKAKLADYVAASAAHIAERCRNAEAEFEAIHGLTNQIELVLKHHEELSRGERHVEGVALAEIVEGAAKLAAQTRYPAIDVRIAPALARMPTVAAQRVVLRQVLDNVVVNAAQAIERAKPDKGVISFDARDLGGRIELSIADNGDGIAAEHLDSIFKRGFTLRKGSGKGLGLHYCATNLGAMHGSIKAESQGPGLGATFRIVLPAHDTKEKAA
jgi:signal transduction histidine kinase